MSTGPQFFQTLMGRQFYEGTMPEIARQLKRVADGLEKQQQAQKVPEPTQGPSLQVPKEPAPAVPPGPPPDKLVGRILDITTGHVSKEGAEFLDHTLKASQGFWLDSPECPRDVWVPVYSRGQYGWFIGVPDGTKDLTGEQGAESIVALLNYANAHNIAWILLDCDSDAVPGLHLYDW